MDHDIPFGEVRLLNCGVGKTAKATLKPGKGLNLGAGKNQVIETELMGGVVGIVLDTRGRAPFVLPVEASERVPRLKKWMKAMDAYPQSVLS